MRNLVVILSVDWEPDHGRWNCGGKEMDYGGVLKGTPGFCSLLDELQIPCTWFVETSYDPKRDLPSCFPTLIRQLAQRKQDEIGLHIHWRKPAANNSVYYETCDTAWISSQIDRGVRQLGTLGVRPKSFRSGALLYIPGLPRILRAAGFQVDSSTLWGRANRLSPDRKRPAKKSQLSRLGTLVHRVLAIPPAPYCTDYSEVEKTGNLELVEFPIGYSLFDAKQAGIGLLSRWLAKKAALAGGSRYLMLFFHIDELTRSDTGPDEQTEPDSAMLRHFREHLAALKGQGAQFLTCAAARTHWLKSAKSGISRQPAAPEEMS